MGAKEQHRVDHKKIRLLIKLVRCLVPVRGWRYRLRRKLNEVQYREDIELCRGYLRRVGGLGRDANADSDPVAPKIIWQCWFQGEEVAPDIVKVCFESVKKHAADYQRIIITHNNIKDYVCIPDPVMEKYERGLISQTHFSDILRVCLLSEYGGIWIDATVLLSGPLPSDIKEADFFLFQNPNQKSLTIAANWFMVSKPHHPLVDLMKRFLMIYWAENDNMRNYFLFHFFLTEAVTHSECYKSLFQQIPFYSKITAHQLQKHIKKRGGRKKALSILRKSPIHKMTYKQGFCINSSIAKSMTHE